MKPVVVVENGVRGLGIQHRRAEPFEGLAQILAVEIDDTPVALGRGVQQFAEVLEEELSSPRHEGAQNEHAQARPLLLS